MLPFTGSRKASAVRACITVTWGGFFVAMLTGEGAYDAHVVLVILMQGWKKAEGLVRAKP